jgi:threonyl-tRNA synthetase
MPITDKVLEYAKQTEAALRAEGCRVPGDYRPERVNYKIREAQSL